MHLNLIAAPTDLDALFTVRALCDTISDLHDRLERTGYFELSEKDDYRLRLALADLARVGDNVARVARGDDPR